MLPNWVMAWSMIDADPRGALVRLDQVIALAHRYHDLEIEAHALAAKAMAHARLGERAAAERDTAEALEVVKTTGSVLKEADVNLLAGYTYLDLGDFQRGLDYSRRGLDGALSVGAVQCAASAYYCQGLGRLLTNEMPEAMVAFAESVKMAERSLGEYLPEHGIRGYDVAAEGLANQGRAGLAIARYRAGEQAALADVERALESARALGDAYTSAMVAETLSEIYLALGDRAAAETHVAASLEYYRRNGMTPSVERAEELLTTIREAKIPARSE